APTREFLCGIRNQTRDQHLYGGVRLGAVAEHDRALLTKGFGRGFQDGRLPVTSGPDQEESLAVLHGADASRDLLLSIDQVRGRQLAPVLKGISHRGLPASNYGLRGARIMQIPITRLCIMLEPIDKPVPRETSSAGIPSCCGSGAATRSPVRAFSARSSHSPSTPQCRGCWRSPQTR